MYQSIKPYIHPRLKGVVEAKNKLFEVSKFHNGAIHILMPEIMDENISELKKVFEELGIDYDIRFAHKTNKSSALARQAKLNKINIDVASYNELVSALSNGFTGKEISCSGPKGKKFLLLALQHNCLISIDSVNELETIIDLSKKYNISSIDIVVRINDLAGNDRTLLKKNTKFGISQNKLEEIKNLIKKNEFINLKGIHFHFDEFQSEIKAGAIENILDIFQQLYSEGFTPTIIDIGGGFRGKELEDRGDWEKYIDFLSDAKRNNTLSDTWGNRAYGIHTNERGGIEGREIVTKRYRELNNSEFLKSILTKEFEENQPIYKKINESLFKVMIEPGYSLSINTGFTILKVESYKTLNNGDEAITVNANILNLSSRMWEYYLDPILVAKEEKNGGDFYGYILGNLCRDDDVLIQRKVHFSQRPKVGDLILLMNTSSYISDFEDGNPIQQEVGKKFIAKNINNSIEIFDENSSELI